MSNNSKKHAKYNLLPNVHFCPPIPLARGNYYYQVQFFTLVPVPLVSKAKKYSKCTQESTNAETPFILPCTHTGPFFEHYSLSCFRDQTITYIVLAHPFLQLHNILWNECILTYLKLHNGNLTSLLRCIKPSMSDVTLQPRHTHNKEQVPKESKQSSRLGRERWGSRSGESSISAELFIVLHCIFISLI